MLKIVNDIDTATKLFNDNKALIHYTMKKMNALHTTNIKDLNLNCQEALWRACLSYNKNKGKFSTYAMTIIKNEIYDFFNENSQFYEHTIPLDESNLDYNNQKFNNDTFSLHNLLYDKTNYFDDIIDKIEIESVMHLLNEKEKNICTKLMLGKTQTEIAIDNNVSRQRISKIIKNMQKKLKKI